MDDNPWDDIYCRDGHIFTDIPHVIPEFAELLEQNGLIGSHLLDVGCGNGRHLSIFQDAVTKFSALTVHPPRYDFHKNG